MSCRKWLEQVQHIYGFVYRGLTKDTCHPAMLKQGKHRLCNVLVLTRAWADAWSTAATDSEVLDSMSSKTTSMFS